MIIILILHSPPCSREKKQIRKSNTLSLETCSRTTSKQNSCFSTQAVRSTFQWKEYVSRHHKSRKNRSKEVLVKSLDYEFKFILQHFRIILELFWKTYIYSCEGKQAEFQLVLMLFFSINVLKDSFKHHRFTAQVH